MALPTTSDTMLSIIYDGERYRVPAGRTILSALEAVGMRFVRGVGCRGGVCGACTVFYRIRGSYDLHAALMCQDLIQEGMEILPLPYFPQKKATYTLDLPDAETTPHFQILQYYPEVNNCIMCGECTRICPVGIDVMGFVGMIKRGDLKGAARESLTCIQCQSCAMRCPSRISQPNAALAARRFYARHLVRPAEHLTRMLERIEEEGMKKAFLKLRRMDAEELRALYQRREREPEEAPPGTWLPDDLSLL